MVTKYRNPINLPISGHKLVTCHYPLRIDTYSSCFHECLYCYGRSILSSVNAWTPLKVKVADINEIKENLFHYMYQEDSSKNKNSIAKAIQNKVPVRIGGQTDCFQPAEKKHRVSLDLIKFLNSIDYPYLIVTKSDLLREEEYLYSLRKDLAYVQITITTLDRTVARLLETRAPSPESRLWTLKKLREKGVFVAGRISPIIPQINEEGLFSLIDEMEKSGVPHIVFEFFRGSEEMIKEIENATGIKVQPMEERGFYLRMSNFKKEELYRAVAQYMYHRLPTFTFCSDGTPLPYDIHSCLNCCGWDTLIKQLPRSRFGFGNEKVAPVVFQRMKEQGEVYRGNFADCFTFTEEAFRKCWYKGEFTSYLPHCGWDHKRKKYFWKK